MRLLYILQHCFWIVTLTHSLCGRPPDQSNMVGSYSFDERGYYYIIVDTTIVPNYI